MFERGLSSGCELSYQPSCIHSHPKGKEEKEGGQCGVTMVCFIFIFIIFAVATTSFTMRTGSTIKRAYLVMINHWQSLAAGERGEETGEY